MGSDLNTTIDAGDKLLATANWGSLVRAIINIVAAGFGVKFNYDGQGWAATIAAPLAGLVITSVWSWLKNRALLNATPPGATTPVVFESPVGPNLSASRVGPTGVALLLLTGVVATIMVTGCAGTTGPDVTQGLNGQTAKNSGGDRITVTDDPSGTGAGTTTVDASGPVFISNQSANNSDVRSSGGVMTQIVIDRSTGKLTYTSGKDITGKILSDGATGNPTSIEFTASATEPLKAFATVAEVRAKLEAALAVSQADYLKQFSADQRDTAKAAFDALGPVLLKAIGVP